jgi:hypothetical protein
MRAPRRSVDGQANDELGRALGELAGGGDPRPGALAQVGRLALASMRRAGAAAVASGRWIADTLIDTAPRIPVRDVDLLRRQHPGLSAPGLAGELVRTATRVTGAFGAAAGALVAVEELTPPAWVAIPAELVVETLAIAAVEMKLIAELHAVYGRPLPGTPRERGILLARAWAEGRGVDPAALATPAGLSALLSVGARRQAVHAVRRRLVRRTARSFAAVAPLLVGAVAGAELNRRGTRALADAVIGDLTSS